MSRPSALALILAAALPAHAQAPSVEVAAADLQALGARAAAFEAAMVSDAPQAVLDFTPPAILALILEAQGLSEQDLLAAYREQQRALGVTVVGFDMPGHALAIGLTPRGRPYAFILAEAEEVVGADRFTNPGLVVALQDEGQWFFATSEIGGADSLAILLAAYPEFETVESVSPSYDTLAEEAAQAWR